MVRRTTSNRRNHPIAPAARQILGGRSSERPAELPDSSCGGLVPNVLRRRWRFVERDVLIRSAVERISESGETHEACVAFPSVPKLSNQLVRRAS